MGASRRRISHFMWHAQPKNSKEFTKKCTQNRYNKKHTPPNVRHHLRLTTPPLSLVHHRLTSLHPPSRLWTKPPPPPPPPLLLLHSHVAALISPGCIGVRKHLSQNVPKCGAYLDSLLQREYNACYNRACFAFICRVFDAHSNGCNIINCSTQKNNHRLPGFDVCLSQPHPSELDLCLQEACPR